MRIGQIISLFILYAVVSLLTFGILYFSTSQISLQQIIVQPTPTLTPTPTPLPTLTPVPTRIPTVSPTPTPFQNPTSTPKPLSLDELFAKYGAQYNVSPDVLKKIAGCESGFNPNAVRDDYAGLFQFASFAWVEARARIGLSNDQNLRFNAEESIRTAAHEINFKGTSGWSDCE